MYDKTDKGIDNDTTVKSKYLSTVLRAKVISDGLTAVDPSLGAVGRVHNKERQAVHRIHLKKATRKIGHCLYVESHFEALRGI